MACGHCHRDSCTAAKMSGGRLLDCVLDCRDATKARAERAEADLADMRAEAERWVSGGWRNRADHDVSRANGNNEAAEAILAALEGEKE